MNLPVAGYIADQPRRLAGWFKGTLRPDQVTPLDLLIIQGTRFCNLNCSYCYLPFRGQKGRFDLDLIDRLFPKLMDAGLIPPVLSLAWHAGEPLVLPIEYYEEAFERIARQVGPEVTVRHHFQTNATLVTDDYCAFIKKHDVQIGVSLDGPPHLHDARRKMRSGKGSFEEAMLGVELLKKHGVNHTAICVLTRESLKQPDAIYEFFRDIGCRQLGFNVEEVEGFNKSTSLGSESVAEYKAFLRHLLTRIRAEHRIMQLREIDLTANLVLHSLAGIPTRSSEADPFCNMAIDVDGNLYTFSPEMVDIKGPQGESLALGHIDDIDFDTLMADTRFLAIADPIAQGLELCRQTCGYFDTCGGAAPVNRLSENGTFVSTETLHCRLTRQAIIDLVEEDLVARIGVRRAKRGKGPSTPPPPTMHSQSRATASQPLALGFPIPGATGIPNNIEISSGAMPARPVPALNLQDGALQPRPDWRRPTADELQLIEGNIRPDRPYDYVALVQLPPQLWSSLEPARPRITAPEESKGSLPPELVEETARLFGDYSGRHVSLGFHRRNGRRPIATEDAQTGELIGLHVDSWNNKPAAERQDSGNRVCVNLGRESRQLLLVNAPLGRVVATMKQLEGEDIQHLNPTEIGRRFLARFPTFPVLRLRVEPGQAYVAPTEILIHDGDTSGADEDFFMTILGRFPAASVVQFLAGSRRTADVAAVA